MKKIVLVCLIFILLLLSCGCATKTAQKTNPTEANIENTESGFQNNINDILMIYEDSIKENISLYCENYLTYHSSPINNLDSVKSALTEQYYNQTKATQNYHHEDKEYEQATALNELFYEDFSTPTKQTKILAHCYQSVVIKNKSTTYNTFYVFDMKYEDGKGWLIDSVEKPAYEYLEEPNE